MVLDDITQQKEYIFAVFRLRLLIFGAEACRLVSGGGCMSTMTVRIPEEKRDMLKIVAGIEKRDIKEILTKLVDEYLERHTETLEIFSKPGWVKAINAGLKAAEKGDIITWRRNRTGK
jgi:predicted transcriptional regulator